MLVRGVGIRDISKIEEVSIGKVLTVLAKSSYSITPKKKHYDHIEVDEFWTYVQKKENKQWLIYAYDRETREIITYVWGKRDLRTAKKLKKQLKELNITYDSIATDDWKSFKTTFKDATKYRHFADTVTQIITDTNTAIKVRSTRSAKGKDTPTTPAKS